MKATDLIGKTIKAFRRNRSMEFILFDDGETYIQFTKQDPYDYHDCSPYAREVDVQADKKFWQELFDEHGGTTELKNFDMW